MRVLVTSSRNYRLGWLVVAVLDQIHTEHPGMTLVHGACKEGGDATADRWAIRRGVLVERHPAEWRRFGRSAGPRRNEHMVGLGADRCEAFIALCVKPDCDRSPEPHGSHGASDTAAMAAAGGIPTTPWLSPEFARLLLAGAGVDLGWRTW